MNSSDQRVAAIIDWLKRVSATPLTNIRPASADASFRRYFRVDDAQQDRTLIVMDAPPEKEDCAPFIYVTELLRDAGVHAPEIIAKSSSQGFLLLSDLGDRTYLDHLQDSADTLYSDAIDCLIKMQRIQSDLPDYDAHRLIDELALFEQWYLNEHLSITLDHLQEQMLAETMRLLCDNAEQQPQVFVHRDYHSRNLMITEDNNPGVIDFQDAVIGPVTYDLVSLFKDCYIEWPRDLIEHWLDEYLEKSPVGFEREKFIRWFDLMGVQRHLKVLGIFARLNYRDGKTQYLDDLPLTLKYVLDACERYQELASLRELLHQVLPELTEA